MPPRWKPWKGDTMAQPIKADPQIVARARAAGFSWRQIAAALKCSENGLHRYLKRTGYKDTDTARELAANQSIMELLATPTTPEIF